MKLSSMKKMLSVMLCMVLIAALALIFAACSSNNSEAPKDPVNYTVVVVDLEGKETSYQITSSKATVGEELLEQGIIAGEQKDYGLYVTTVNGITLDWDKDGMYWGFYINGEFAMTGLDATNAESDAVYMLKPES